MNAFQLYAAYNNNKDRIERVKQLGRPLVDMALDRLPQMIEDIKALVTAFDLHEPKHTNPAQYDVEWIQKSLAKAGLQIQATGEYDAQTQAAVKQFQAANGLDADGWVGPLTAERLEKL